MRWTGAKNFSPIGIDLGARTIKAAQLIHRRTTAWRWHAGFVLAQPEANHPLDRNTARHLRDVLYRHGFCGNDIVLAAPMNQLEVDVLELPPRSSGAPIEQIARMEMARSAKLEESPFELQCWDLPARARGTSAATSVMAVALRHADAEALIEPFEAEGFNVVAVDARCWALARAGRALQTADTVTAMLDVGWKKAAIDLLCDGVVVYQRMLEHVGLGSLYDLLGEELQLVEDETDYVLRNIGIAADAQASDADNAAQTRRIQQLISRHLEGLLGEIQAAFQYATHRYPQTAINRLLLVGGGSIVKGACEWLGPRLGTEVKVLSPGQILECPQSLPSRTSDGMLTAAIGLAMHGMD